MSKEKPEKYLDEKYSSHVFGWREGFMLGITYLFSILIVTAFVSSGIVENEILLNLFSYVFTFSLCISVFYIFILKSTGKKLRFNFRTTSFYTYIVVFPLMLGGMLISEYFVELIPTSGDFWGIWWENINNILEKMLENPIYMVLLTCVFAPILEEVLFRGILQKGLINKGISPIRAIFLSSFIFGVMHANPWQFIPAVVLGLILGWVYCKTKTLLLPIFLHAFNNLSACVLALNKKQSFTDLIEVKIEYALIIGILLVISFGYLFSTTKQSVCTKIKNS